MKTSRITLTTAIVAGLAMQSAAQSSLSNFAANSASTLSPVSFTWGGTFVPANSGEVTAMGQMLPFGAPVRPHLTLNAQRITRINQLKNTDATMQTYYAGLIDHVDWLLLQPVYTVQNVDSRMSEERITALALAYRLTNNTAYAEKARQYLSTLVAMPDWRAEATVLHVLAEFTSAAAIGYDWIYDYLTPSERTALRNAIVNKGLNVALARYRSGSTQQWWTWSGLNIAMVCNSGFITGALAIRDTDPSVSSEVLAHAQKSLALAMASLNNDGGWIEHHGYWVYGVGRLIRGFDMLETSLGTDLGLDAGGFLSKTGLYKVLAGGRGPRGTACFDFGNTYPLNEGAPELYWLASKFGQAPLAAYQKTLHQDGQLIKPWDLIWYVPSTSGDLANLPKAGVFRNNAQFFARNSWSTVEPNAIAFKGGDNKANHNQPDIGHFLYESQGVRWFLDLGRTADQQPGPGGKFYRNSTLGHNTLRFNEGEQPSTAQASMIAFSNRDANQFGIIDGTQATGGAAALWKRGVALRGGSTVVVQDEWTAAPRTRVDWTAYTTATLEPGPGRKSVYMTKDGKTVTVAILYPPTVSFQVSSGYIKAPESPIPGLKKVTLMYRPTTIWNRMVVAIMPGRRALSDFNSVRQSFLDDWVNEANLP